MIALDIHTHSIASGHGTQDTITDMAKEAARKDMQILGISDHGPSTFGSGTVSYFKNLKLAPKERFGIRILYGAELNILDEKGRVDLPDEVLSQLDYAIASMHQPPLTPGSITENTMRYINAMRNPYIHIIGHCDDGKFPVDYTALAQAAKEYHVLLEINNMSLSPDSYRLNSIQNCHTLLNACATLQLPLLLSSDSHGKKQVGDMQYALDLIQQTAYPDSLILNYHLTRLLDFLQI